MDQLLKEVVDLTEQMKVKILVCEKNCKSHSGTQIGSINHAQMSQLLTLIKNN